MRKSTLIQLTSIVVAIFAIALMGWMAYETWLTQPWPGSIAYWLRKIGLFVLPLLGVSLAVGALVLGAELAARVR